MKGEGNRRSLRGPLLFAVVSGLALSASGCFIESGPNCVQHETSDPTCIPDLTISWRIVDDVTKVVLTCAEAGADTVTALIDGGGFCNEVVPFVHTHCQSPGIPITTWGASLGAYHAVNTLLRYPHLVKRCYGFSGVYDLRRFMDGLYDDNFYFHNPIDYMASISDGWFLDQLNSCEIRLVTGSGPWEDSRHTYAFASVLARKGIRHYVDDWGWKGGHDWPYWKEMIREYLSR